MQRFPKWGTRTPKGYAERSKGYAAQRQPGVEKNCFTELNSINLLLSELSLQYHIHYPHSTVVYNTNIVFYPIKSPHKTHMCIVSDVAN